MKINRYSSQKLEKLLKERTSQEIDEQIFDATTIVSKINSIDSASAYSKIAERIKGRDKVNLYLTILTRIAAVLFIPLLLASIWLYTYPVSSQLLTAHSTQEISSPPGVRSKIVLPDGSQVWLNAESTLRFGIPFGSKTREISLSGEAFFDVMKNLEIPFIVQSGKAIVKVSGTRFNVKAFGNENYVEVVLEEGKVSLNTTGVSGTNDLVMKPGERAVFDKTSSQTKLTSENIEKYLAWHNGKLVFDETPIHEVATQLSRWYGVEVTIADPKINKFKITTTFENESLQQVLELLKLSSPIRIQYVAVQVNDTTKAHSRSKVIFSGIN